MVSLPRFRASGNDEPRPTRKPPSPTVASVALFASISAIYDNGPRYGFRCRFAGGGYRDMKAAALRSYTAFVQAAALTGAFFAVEVLEGRQTPAKARMWREHVAAAIRAGWQIEWWREAHPAEQVAAS